MVVAIFIYGRIHISGMQQANALSRNEGTKLRYSKNSRNLFPCMTSKLLRKMVETFQSGKSSIMKNAGKNGSVRIREMAEHTTMITHSFIVALYRTLYASRKSSLPIRFPDKKGLNPLIEFSLKKGIESITFVYCMDAILKGMTQMDSISAMTAPTCRIFRVFFRNP